MKNYQKKCMAVVATALISLFTACGAPGSEERTNTDETTSTSTDSSAASDAAQRRADTMSTGVPGNTNVVNSQGDAGNGSGMGTQPSTEAQQKH